jgi:PAS domain S-box-containing protein
MIGAMRVRTCEEWSDGAQQNPGALRENEELLRAVTNTAQVGLVIVDPDHRYRYANPAYATIFHLPSADIIGQRVAEVLTTVYDEQIRPRLLMAFGGKHVNYELVIPPASEEQAARHYDVTYEPGVYRGSRVVVVVVVDITERKLAELALTRSTERLRILATASRLFAEGFTGDEVRQPQRGYGAQYLDPQLAGRVAQPG